MSWENQLSNSIRIAAAAGNGRCTIAVHDEEQLRLGEQAAGQLLPDPNLLPFKLIPEEDWEKIPVGTIFVSSPT